MCQNEEITYIAKEILETKRNESILLKLWNWWKPAKNDIVIDSVSNMEAIVAFVYRQGNYIDICRPGSGITQERIKAQIYLLPTENQIRNFVEETGECIIKSVPSKNYNGEWVYHIALIPKEKGSVRDYQHIQHTSYLMTLWEVACSLVKDMEAERVKKENLVKRKFHIV